MYFHLSYSNKYIFFISLFHQFQGRQSLEHKINSQGYTFTRELLYIKWFSLLCFTHQRTEITHYHFVWRLMGQVDKSLWTSNTEIFKYHNYTVKTANKCLPRKTQNMDIIDKWSLFGSKNVLYY